MQHFSKQRSDSTFEHSVEVDFQHKNKQALIEANQERQEEVKEQKRDIFARFVKKIFKRERTEEFDRVTDANITLQSARQVSQDKILELKSMLPPKLGGNKARSDPMKI